MFNHMHIKLLVSMMSVYRHPQYSCSFCLFKYPHNLLFQVQLSQASRQPSLIDLFHIIGMFFHNLSRVKVNILFQLTHI
jgi:hypothetical protein